MIGTKVIDSKFSLWGIIWRVLPSMLGGSRYQIRWCDGSVETVHERTLTDWGYTLS